MTDSTTTAHATRTPQSLTSKRIDVKFQVLSGALGPQTTDDVVTLSGLRARATITQLGMGLGSSLSLRVEGMTLALMNRLSVVVGLPSTDNNNSQLASNCIVTVSAGDNVTGMQTIFVGQIFEAFVDFTGAPNVAYQLSANDGVQYRRTLIAPTSFQGPTPVATIFSDLAYKAAGLSSDNTSGPPVAGSGAFVGHGLTETVNGYYGWGDAMSQIHKLAQSIRAFHYFDTFGTLHVWSKRYADTEKDTTLVVKRGTGLIGYPAYNQAGVSLATLFNPTFQLKVPFRLQSNYEPSGWVNNQAGQNIPQMPSSGLWCPMTITHDLASEMPNGPWYTQVTAIRNDLSSDRKAV